MSWRWWRVLLSGSSILSTRSSGRAAGGRRHRYLGLAVALGFLLSGSLLVATISSRTVAGAVPGKEPILAMASLDEGLLVGTAGGLFSSADGVRWSRVPGISGLSLVATTGQGAVVLAGGSLYEATDLSGVRKVREKMGAALAIADDLSGSTYIARTPKRIYVVSNQAQERTINVEQGPPEILALAAGPGNASGQPGGLVAGGLTSGLWRSTDGGASFQKILGTPARAVLADARKRGRLLLATAGGVLVSADGRAWSFANLRIPVEAMSQNNTAYFGVGQDRLVYTSPDGLRWRRLAP